MTSLRTSTITAALILGTFVALMVPGFWLRFGMFPWEMIHG